MFKFLKKLIEPKSLNYITEVAAKIEINGVVTVDDNPPFRMKKGEKFIFETPAVLGTYKRDGRVGYSGVTGSIPIVKGVRLRAGSGRMVMGKSWVFDDPGSLIFTTERVIFNGSTKNSSVKLEKVIKMGFDPRLDALYLDRESGADWCFKLQSLPTPEKLATAFMFQRGMAQIG